jgi:hypothetical protein
MIHQAISKPTVSVRSCMFSVALPLIPGLCSCVDEAIGIKSVGILVSPAMYR